MKMRVHVACLFLLISISSAHKIMKRRTGDQAPPGECVLFIGGGKSRLHFYACCNNCQSYDRSCDGRTYHRASSESYCNRCGVDNQKGNGIKRSSFPCGGCEGQNNVYGKCANFLNNIPGFCWVFTTCFQWKCNHMAYTDTCFDGVCQPGETVENCPIDCCASKNAQCARNGKCPPECCGTPTCCNSGSTMAKDIFRLLTFLVMINGLKDFISIAL